MVSPEPGRPSSSSVGSAAAASTSDTRCNAHGRAGQYLVHLIPPPIQQVRRADNEDAAHRLDLARQAGQTHRRRVSSMCCGVSMAATTREIKRFACTNFAENERVLSGKQPFHGKQHAQHRLNRLSLGAIRL